MKHLIRYFLVGILAGVVVAGGCSCKNNGAAGGNKNPGAKTPVVFELPDMNGEKIKVEPGADGKPLMIVFFASWCKACAEEAPEINRIYSDYAEKGVISLYAVNAGDSRKVVEEMIKKHGMNYPVLLDEEQKLLRDMKIIGLPMNILYDSEGAEVYRHAEPPDESVLGKILVK